MTDPSPPASVPRWLAYVPTAGAILAVAGVLIATGQWREKTDNLEQRVSIVENIQRTNLPAFYGMQVDLKYLAERARRADDAAARDHRP